MTFTTLKNSRRKLVGFASSLILSLMLASTGHSRETSLCVSDLEAIRMGAAAVGPKNFSSSLKQNGQTHWMLFLSVTDDKSSEKPWRLFQRQSQTLTYCLVGSGKEFEALGSFHKAIPQRRYGMPGSGYPRCHSGPGNPLPGSVMVRMWANVELGESAVFVLNDDTSGSMSYTMLLSNDGYWILLETSKNDNNYSCYLSRGEASTTYIDLVMKNLL